MKIPSFRLTHAAALSAVVGLSGISVVSPAMAQDTMAMSASTMSSMPSPSDRYLAQWVYTNLDAYQVNRYKARGFSEETIKGAANIALRSGLDLDYVLRRVAISGQPLGEIAALYGVGMSDLNNEIPGMGGMGGMKMSEMSGNSDLLPAGLMFGDAVTASTPPPNFGVTEAQKKQGVQDAMRRADPQMRAVLEQLVQFGSPPLYTLTPAQVRQQPGPADAVKAVLKAQGKSTEPEAVGNVRDTMIPGPAGQVPVRVYTPRGEGPFPTVVYFHGGGWVIASIDAYDASCRALTNAANAVVVSVGYRQAPENKLPAAHEDSYAATQYVMNNAAEFNADPNHVAVAGESAGGNLAAAVCLMARERGGKMPVHQVLVYPIAGFDLSTLSYQENAHAIPLDQPFMAWFFYYALPTREFGNNPLVALVRANPSRELPPATVITDAIDPLRSEGQRYAEKLRAAGIPVRYRNYEGVTHEFFSMSAVVDKAKDAVNFAAEGLKMGFGK